MASGDESPDPVWWHFGILVVGVSILLVLGKLGQLVSKWITARLTPSHCKATLKSQPTAADQTKDAQDTCTANNEVKIDINISPPALRESLPAIYVMNMPAVRAEIQEEPDSLSPTTGNVDNVTGKPASSNSESLDAASQVTPDQEKNVAPSEKRKKKVQESPKAVRPSPPERDEEGYRVKGVMETVEPDKAAGVTKKKWTKPATPDKASPSSPAATEEGPSGERKVVASSNRLSPAKVASPRGSKGSSQQASARDIVAASRDKGWRRHGKDDDRDISASTSNGSASDNPA